MERKCNQDSRNKIRNDCCITFLLIVVSTIIAELLLLLLLLRKTSIKKLKNYP